MFPKLPQSSLGILRVPQEHSLTWTPPHLRTIQINQPIFWSLPTNSHGIHSAEKRPNWKRGFIGITTATPVFSNTCDGFHFSLVSIFWGIITTSNFLLTKVLLKPEFLRISIAHIPEQITMIPKPEWSWHFAGDSLTITTIWRNTQHAGTGLSLFF